MNELDIPELVRSIRGNTGWTQERLAQEMGVSFSTINSWERGKRRPMPFLLRRLVELADETSSNDTKRGENR